VIRRAYFKRFLAGAVFGLYMGHLLYLLNPQVEVTPASLVGATLLYALIAGLIFGTALWLLRIARERLIGAPELAGERTHGFGFVVVAAFVASAVFWIHLEAVRIYLPIAAVHLLIKATNLITAVAFVLLVLWFFERNARRRTARWIFAAGVVLIALTSFFLYQRRDRYRSEDRTVVVANVGTIARERPVIVVAIRNLPYDWLVTLAGEGGLPFFDQARQRAYFTRLEPFATSGPNALWASLATGKLPFRHNVTGRFAYETPLNRREPFLLLPGGVAFHIWGLVPPVHRLSAPLPAGNALPLWRMFERLSLRAAVVNWPAVQRDAASYVVPAGALPRPARINIAAVAQRFRATGEAQQRIVRGLTSDLGATDALRGAIAQHAYELDVVALDGFSEAQRALHIWSNELPAKSSVKGEALRTYVAQLDAMLAGIAREHPDHLLVVVSPSGPNPPALPDTPYFQLRDAIAADDPGADDGFVVITGSGTTHRDNPRTAQAIDVVPTVLFAAGLPSARDLDGRVLTDPFDDAFLRANPLSLIASYEAKQIVVRRGGM
jgi:hypothetical protein